MLDNSDSAKDSSGMCENADEEELHKRRQANTRNYSGKDLIINIHMPGLRALPAK